MACGLSLKCGGAVDERARGADIFRPLRDGGGYIEARGGVRARLQVRRDAARGVAPRLERVQLYRQRSLRGLGDLGVQLGEFDGGEADLVGERLAVDEGGVERRCEQRLGGLGGGLDKIAEDGVVTDLQRNAAFAGLGGLPAAG